MPNTMDLQAIWLAALGELELSLSKANFTTWFRNTTIGAVEGVRAIVIVPNTFTKSWLEKKYHEAIIKALRHVTSNAVREAVYRVEMRSAGGHAPVAGTMDGAPALTPAVAVPGVTLTHSSSASAGVASEEVETQEVGLNPRYTFEQFVVGKGNELAHAAAMAAAANPGKAYNPVFIYGSVGLGKTHLLQAVGHHVLKTRPDAVVRYITCERFINEFIQSVRGGRAREFKDHYRKVDVLLVDDIQFITGKQGTQDEFFHTFNALHQLDKQIVLTSDRSPKEIQALESRLQSRFEWGMIIDVSTPDFETRVAILDAKCQAKRAPMSGDILRLIAGTIQSNIRELEGVLNKIVAYHQFKNITPTVASVETLLRSFVPTTPRRSITPKRILDIVTAYYDITSDDLVGKSREKRLAFPRQVAMYLLREETKCSYPSIGTHLGGRDHTTAMHACTKITELLASDEQLKQDIALLREKAYAELSAS